MALRLQMVCNFTPGETAYLRRWWFSPQGFWPNQYPVEPLIRRYMIKAIEVAGNLPIDTYWLTVGTEFRMFITKSAWQITRMMITPDPDALSLLRYGREYNVEILHQTAVPIWLLKRDYEGHLLTLDIGGICPSPIQNKKQPVIMPCCRCARVRHSSSWKHGYAGPYSSGQQSALPPSCPHMRPHGWCRVTSHS